MTKLWAMIETPVAILDALSIARASERLSVLVMGTNDLVKELYAEHVPGRAPILPSLHTALLAARAAGIVIIDGVYNDVKNVDGFLAEVEQGRHYLWRFWERLPARRNWAIFDRTWYGRVLVERIEGFCTKEEWKRAYREINEFERQLTDDGVHIVKFLIHVSPEEQKRRMIERLEDPHKRHKLGVEDFRNIARRKLYVEAYDEMLEKTDTDHAPWHVIATDNKKTARLEGMRLLVQTIGKGVKIGENELDPMIAEAAAKLWGWRPGGRKDKDKSDKEK